MPFANFEMDSIRSSYNRTIRSRDRERGNRIDYTRRSITPVRTERLWNPSSRSPSPEMTRYTRHRDRDENNSSQRAENYVFNGREQFHRVDDFRDRSLMNDRRDDQRSFDTDEDYAERNDRYASFDSDSRDRSRSPLSSRDYNRKLTRYDDSPKHGRFNSLHHETSYGYRGCLPHREQRHFKFGESGFDEQRRKCKTKDRGNHSRESKYLSRSFKIPSHPLMICKFYNNEGTCKKGQTCAYLHVCKYFINDDCKFGNRCIRSHNVLEMQPRSILAKYGMVPRYYNRMNEGQVREITRLVKEKLDDQESRMNTDISRKDFMHQAQKRRTYVHGGVSLFDQISDYGNISDESCQENMNRTFRRSLSIDSYSRASLEDINEPSQALSKDFIPFEQKTSADTKAIVQTKRLKSKSKSKKKRHEKMKIKTEKDEILSTTQDTDIKNRTKLFQPAITFDLSDQCGKFQVRKENDHWQISTMGDDWLDLNEDAGKMMEELCHKATKVKEVFDRMRKEQKL